MKEEVLKKQTYKQLKNKEISYSATLGVTIGFIGIIALLSLNRIGLTSTIIPGSLLLISALFLFKKLKVTKKEIQIREKEDPHLKENKLKNLSIEELQKKSKLQYGLIGAFIGLIIVFIGVEFFSYVTIGELNFATSIGLFPFLFFIPLLLKEVKVIKEELKRRDI